jgi:hypothetical protein
LVGAAVPEQFAPCSGRRCCRALHHPALVCNDDVLGAHLPVRAPAWRRSGTAEVIATMLDSNHQLRAHAATSPPMRLFDTSHLPSRQTVALTQTWIQQHWPKIAQRE